VELKEGLVQVVADDGSFDLTARFVDGILYFYPYRDADFEFAPKWHHLRGDNQGEKPATIRMRMLRRGRIEGRA